MKVSPCPNCASDDLRTTTAEASSNFGPDLLPGTRGMFRQSTFDVVVCCTCGLTRFFASPEEIQRVMKSGLWDVVRG